VLKNSSGFFLPFAANPRMEVRRILLFFDCVKSGGSQKGQAFSFFETAYHFLRTQACKWFQGKMGKWFACFAFETLIGRAFRSAKNL
jgi:hypothetical protein